MNLELTTACPLNCPQCYCNLDTGKHIDLAFAQKRIEEGLALGMRVLNMSGGETMCYPHLYDLVAFASKRGLEVNIAISGAFFDQTAFARLINAGIDSISVSLNGSTEEINSYSRDGYYMAIQALEILKRNHYTNTILNWVMHSTNADDFPNLIQLAEKYNVSVIDVIGFKPDSENQLKTLPTLEQISRVSKLIKEYSGDIKIQIESCYSNMLAYHYNTKLLGNLNFGPKKGCLAGRLGVSVNIDGQYTPCRHIDYAEEFETLEDYWNNSKMLAKLRSVEQDCREPCCSCTYMKYCRHCQAINWQMNHAVYIGFLECPVYSQKVKDIKH